MTSRRWRCILQQQRNHNRAGEDSMTELTRRRFAALTGISIASLSAGALFAPRAVGQAKPRLVVIGGGPAGGTAARYVNKEAAGAIDVTLVEPLQRFTTCFFSNLHVGGFRTVDSLTHGYDKVRSEGATVVHEAAASIDRDKKEVALAGGRRLAYDRLGVAPGLDLQWESVPRLSGAAAEA